MTAVGYTGKIYKIKKVDSSANAATIDASTTETIDGALTQVLVTQNQFITIISNGTNWKIISKDNRLKTLTAISATGSYAALATDDIILHNAAAGNLIINMPTALGISGRNYVVKKNNTSAGTLTISPSGAEIIDGTAYTAGTSGIVLISPYDNAEIVSNGTGWNVVSKSPQAVALTLTDGNAVTTSTTFVDVSGATASIASITMTTSRKKVLATVAGTWGQSTIGSTNYLDLNIDGTRVGGTSGLVIYSNPGTGYNNNLSFSYLTPTALTAGSHTFKLQWKVDANTGTIIMNLTAALSFAVIEQG